MGDGWRGLLRNLKSVESFKLFGYSRKKAIVMGVANSGWFRRYGRLRVGSESNITNQHIESPRDFGFVWLGAGGHTRRVTNRADAPICVG